MHVSSFSGPLQMSWNCQHVLMVIEWNHNSIMEIGAHMSLEYELRICNNCDWHIVQDEKRIILDCPSQDLTDLRTQFQHLFSSVPPK
mmetsp:Transcript_15688/g.42552  ORF Transcript_15688/g.42552 Transcript_15688/m.42552 type:complete len:87 (-) Transcript_15688:365-625(-)